MQPQTLQPSRRLTADEMARLREHATITEDGILAVALARLAFLEAAHENEGALS